MDESEEQATEEHQEMPSTSGSHMCKICHENFDSLQEVLRHELLKHANKNSKKRMDESDEQSTEEDQEMPSTSGSHMCKICHENFDSLQEVLRHELLKHANKNAKKHPVNQLKRRLYAALKTKNGQDEKKSRQDLVDAISDCAEGNELGVILKKFKMNSDDLAFICARIRTCLEDELMKIGLFVRIEMYGSIANGLALKTSDIDLHIASEDPEADPNAIYKTITRMLFRSNCFSDINPIRKARVPIIKCIHKATGFSLDINTCEPYGVHNSNFIHELIKCDKRIHELMLFLKIWSKTVHIYGAFNMTNYCLITLVIFYLQTCEPAVLGSVKIMQRNGPKVLLNGINFGVNVRAIPFDSSQSVHQLIKGFFEFYSFFDFEKFIIAPHLAKAIDRSDFKNRFFLYPEYVQQLQMFGRVNRAEELRIDRPACVQDMFCLNINVGNCLSETNVKYFKRCVTLAHQKCSQPGVSHKNLYKYLLVDLIEEITEVFPPDPTHEPETEIGRPKKGCNMSFNIRPRGHELKSLSKFAIHQLDLRKLWTKEYINAVAQVVSKVYKIDMTQMSPTQNSKFKKFDEAHESSLRDRSWAISCYVDLWSGRQIQRNDKVSFMDYQLAQTEKLHAERRQDSTFAVQFKGTLTVKIFKNYSYIMVKAASSEPVCKTDPFRRFFRALKSSMQNFNLKQRLHELESEMRAY